MDKLQTAQAEYVVNEVKRERAEKPQTSFVTSRRQNMIQDCKYCGRDHQRGKCPAYGEICKKCKKIIHFSSKCMSNALSYATKKPVHMVEEQSDSDSEEMFIDMVKSNNSEDWEVDLIINDRKIRFKIDTGAQCNIPESIHRQTCAQLGKSKAKLVTYGGQCLKPIGKCLLLTEYKRRFHHVKFQVLNQSATPLLGLRTCVRLGLIKRISEVETWPSQDTGEVCRRV